MGLFDTIKAQIGVWKFQRSELGQGLRQHTRQYFYSGQALSWMAEDNKQRLIQDFMGQFVACQQAENPAMALREKLTEFVLMFAGLQVLCLTESEKEGAHYADNPYISGELHHHIGEAFKHNEELSRLVWQHEGEPTPEDIIDMANTRCAVALYYANGLNMARIAIGDTDPAKDWFRPFVEAMLVWEEGQYRSKLGLPELLKGTTLGTLHYFDFMNHVLNGERNPFHTWTKEWPNLYLGGEGPLPE